MLIGPHAQTFSPQAIIGYGPQDALPRNEISDDASVLTLPAGLIDSLQPVKQADGSYKFTQYKTRLDKIFQHDALYAAYPGLRRMPVSFCWPPLCNDPENAGQAASYSPDGICIVPLKDHDTKIKGSLLHELEHTIQDIEGFTPGSNIIREIPRAAAILHDKLVRWQKRASHPLTEQKITHTYCIVLSQMSFFPMPLPQTDEINATLTQVLLRARRRYFANAGEVEARSTTERMDMSATERAQIPPPHLVFKELAEPRERSHDQIVALEAYQSRARKVKVADTFNRLLVKLRLRPATAPAHKP